LQAAFEAAAKRPLEVFFRQWLERPDAPELALHSVERGGQGTVRFTLAQSQAPYRLAVPVVIETVAGAERHVVRLDATESQYALAPAARATALRIDPDYRLFRRLPLEEVAPIIRSLMVAPNAVTAIADADPPAAAEPDVADAARSIAARLLEAGWQPLDIDEAMRAKTPLLLVGTTPQVTAALRRAGVSPPARLVGDGTARVWAARYHGNVPLLVVEGQDADALRQIAAVIRHYGASSWLVFAGSKVIGSGVWPPTAQPLQVELKN
jgi:aminopeptidase N